MLSFTDVNNWFEQYIEPGLNFTQLPQSAITDALSLYDKQSSTFNTHVKADISDFHGSYLFDSLATMMPENYNPKATNRTDNGAGCVILMSYPEDNIFKLFVSLTVPKYYHILVKLELDRERKLTGGNLVMSTLYESSTKKPGRYVITGAGELFDTMKDYKSRVDKNQRIEDPLNNQVTGKLNFVPGKGLVVE